MAYPQPDVRVNLDGVAAYNSNVASYTPIPQFAGRQPEVGTTTGLFLASQTLTIGQVIALNPAGKLVAWVPGAGDSTAKPVGIMADNLTVGASDVTMGYYRQGNFNFGWMNTPNGQTAATVNTAFGLAPSNVNIVVGTVRL